MERVWCPVYPSRVRCNRSPSQERSPEWWGARRTSGSSNSYGNALPGVPASPVHQNIENASLNRLSSEKYVEGTMSFTAAPASAIFKQKKMGLTSTTLASVINHNPPWIPASSIQFAWFMSTGARKHQPPLKLLSRNLQVSATSRHHPRAKYFLWYACGFLMCLTRVSTVSKACKNCGCSSPAYFTA